MSNRRNSSSTKKAAKLLGTNIANVHRHQSPSISNSLASPDGATSTTNATGTIPEAPASSSIPNLLSAINDLSPLSLIHGLRAHPPDTVPPPTSGDLRRALTLPADRPRKTTFVPPPIDLAPGARFLRQSVVSTPYPRVSSLNGDEAAKPRRKSKQETDEGRQAFLTIVVGSSNERGGVPRTGKIAIPWAGARRSSQDHAPTPPPAQVDDEEFARRVWSEYRRLRGRAMVCLSARKMVGARVLAYRHVSELSDLVGAGEAAATHGGKWRAGSWEFGGEPAGEWGVRPRRFRVTDGEFAEQRMLELLRHPRLGRGSSAWVQWVAGLPENNGGEAHAERLALEVLEGWSVRRIAGVGIGVVVASLAALLLWVFLGVGGEESMTVRQGVFEEVHRTEVGRGMGSAGGRVGVGVELSLLTLLLGWTGTAAWIVLSWLRM